MAVRRERRTEVRLAGFDGPDSKVRMVAQRAENMIGEFVSGVDVRKAVNPVDNVIVLWKTKTLKQEGNMF